MMPNRTNFLIKFFDEISRFKELKKNQIYVSYIIEKIKAVIEIIM